MSVGVGGSAVEEGVDEVDEESHEQLVQVLLSRHRLGREEVRVQQTIPRGARGGGRGV